MSATPARRPKPASSAGPRTATRARVRTGAAAAVPDTAAAAATTTGSASASVSPIGVAGAPRWIAPASLAVCAAGLAVSAYLTVAHYASSVTLACPATGAVDCAKVTTSAESVFAGIPVALLGLVFFAAAGVLGLPWLWRHPGRALRVGRVALCVLGVCFAARLVYAELFEIDAICLWCTVVHALAFALFAITVLGTAATATLPEPA
jgi:uncharacterized membrane protein